MGLSKRERLIVLVTLLAVGALVADRFVRAPIANGLGELRVERQKSLAQVTKAKNLLQQRQQIEQKKALLPEGLRSDTEAESLVAKALDKWAEDARLTLTSVKPDRMTGGDKGLKEILFVIAGKGSLDAVSWFLYQVETSELPIKVKHMQLGSTSEAGDNMSLELRISTLYLAADDKSSQKQPQPRQPGKTDEEQLL
jgi:Tfp pilus assembly protein PilO